MRAHHRQTRISRLWLLAATLATLPAAAADAPTAGRRPNIVFVMADDLGWTDLGCQGSGYYETPTIDRFATQGIRFTNHHHCQNCTPTRAALMSGQHPARTGVSTVGAVDRFDWSMRPLQPVPNQPQLPLDRETITDRLELYDLSSDIGERRNLAAAEPERTADLRRMLAEWRADVGVAMPKANKQAVVIPTADVSEPRGDFVEAVRLFFAGEPAESARLFDRRRGGPRRGA
ncbi:MAG: sulfatase-like hydrolase/transferase [Planctomycetota bacterium]